MVFATKQALIFRGEKAFLGGIDLIGEWVGDLVGGDLRLIGEADQSASFPKNVTNW